MAALGVWTKWNQAGQDAPMHAAVMYKDTVRGKTEHIMHCGCLRNAGMAAQLSQAEVHHTLPSLMYTLLYTDADGILCSASLSRSMFNESAVVAKI